MRSVSAHELTRHRFCKRPGCLREARWTNGRLAGLCETHGREEANSPEWASQRERARELGNITRGRLASVTALRDEVRKLQKVERRARQAVIKTGKPGKAGDDLTAQRANVKLAYVRCGIVLVLLKKDAA